MNTPTGSRPPDPRRVVGDAIRLRRYDLDLSQDELAARCGLHRTYVGSVERGERNVSLLNLLKIADALELRVADLVADL